MKWRRNKSNTRRWQRGHLVRVQNNLCAICGKPFKSMKDITFDHKVPISRGGFDLLENYQLAHFPCNQEKGNMTDEEFRQFQKGGEFVE